LKALIDTNILIDQLRGHPAAQIFGKSLPEQAFISAITVTELYAGVRSPQQRDKVTKLAQSYDIVAFDGKAAEIAGEYMERFQKSHGLNISDAAIAATAKIHELELCTLNLKHFPMFPKLKRPY